MKFVIAFLALATLATATSELFSEKELETHFTLFKTEYGRNYNNAEEEAYRKSVFASNLEFILKHNREYLAGRKTFTVGVNDFADMTNAEFRARFNGFKGHSAGFARSSLNRKGTFEVESVEGLPNSTDWTKKNAVTPVKNQKQCGSCWAFSAIAAIEGQHALKTGKLVSLSEQNIVDCSHNGHDAGCGGGLMDSAFDYVLTNGGVDTEESYPYEGRDNRCRFHNKTVGATIDGYLDVGQGSERSLQAAVAHFGPISVAIDASQPSFQLYKSGLYNEPECSSVHLDHGVTAVGYGALNGSPYWKVKNSWGVEWGDNGYILMSRNKGNQCGIATAASFPLII